MRSMAIAAGTAVAVRGTFALSRALSRLSRAVLPSDLLLVHEILGAARTHMIGEAARLGIADRLAAGPRSADELADELAVRADRLHRLLRALASLGVFHLLPDGRFRNNRLSRVLCSAHPSRLGAFAAYFASRANAKAWTVLDEVLRDGESGFEHAHGQSVWTWLSAQADEGHTFEQAMLGLSKRSAPVIASLYPWGEVRVVCDVGGGSGAVLAELLRRHGHLRGILCDQEDVLARGPLLGQHALRERVRLEPLDMFSQAPPAADAYLLKNVLHDWDDERCIEVLSRCRDAAAGARVLIAEQFLEPLALDPLKALSDMQMMVVAGGGRERSREEYAALVKRAGLRPTRVFHHPLIDLFEARAA
jgi:hypothetical protein